MNKGLMLKDVLKGVKLRTGCFVPEVKVTHVTCDSRAAKKGSAFVAFRGFAQDGFRFIGDALDNGASVIVAEKDFNAPDGVYKILVKDTRKALPVIADNFYGKPSTKLKMIGVTGTNGKTTITYLIESIVIAAGKSSGVIGTINYRIKDRKFEAKNTTPGPLELQALFAEMVREKARFAIMEVSSHSLDQGRVDSISFDAAIFTNIKRDHLDYHKTEREYFLAKAKIFDKLKGGGTAILNMDDAKVYGIRKTIRRKVLTFSIHSDKADVFAENIRTGQDGSRFSIVAKGRKIDIKTPLMGMHNVSNILAAAAASLACGIGLAAIKRGIEDFSIVPGRLESVDHDRPFKVFVDFAHTEDALLNVLDIVRRISLNKVITVFGCGGNRDRTKRPLMGRAACSLSDIVVITSDNPRFEDPADIIDEIEAGVKNDFSNYTIEPDRREAIKKAIGLADKGDVVLIAGKGHEKYQIIKDKVLPFDDCEIARGVLKNR